MKRPAFQFYTGDWQKNAKLRRCSPAARGVWIDVLCLMHDSDEYGVLRWPLKDIANAAGASMALVRELVAKGVLKGADKDAEPYVYRAKHAGKEGDPVVLVRSDGGPIWYSSRFVRDEWVRQKRGGSTRFDTDNQPESRQPKGVLGERIGDGPSSSSSTSVGGIEPDGSTPPGPAADLPPSGEYEPPADAHLPGLQYARIAGRIRQAGIGSLDPGYPAFRALVDAGATADEFTGFVADALTKDQPFKWLIGAVSGERKRAAVLATQLHRGPMPNKQEAIEQRNAAVGDAWLAEQGAA